MDTFRVIGDREVAKSPHMSPMKRTLQRLGSFTVGLASGLSVADVTSGFRAFSREAAMQINVFNPFTYTLETVIQAGNRNLGVQSVTLLYRGTEDGMSGYAHEWTAAKDAGAK